STRRPPAATRHPSAANFTATFWPMPVPAPETATTRSRFGSRSLIATSSLAELIRCVRVGFLPISRESVQSHRLASMLRSMHERFIQQSVVGPHIAAVTLSRPERLNALHGPLLRELQDAVDRIERDPEIRV